MSVPIGLADYKKCFQNYIQKLDTGYEISCFVISNTAKKNSGFYFTPIRAIDNIQISGVVVSNSLQAQAFAKLADGRFEYIAVDSEKKLKPCNYTYEGDLGNIEGEVLDTVRQSKIISFKANDVTVDAIDTFLSSKMQGVPKRKVAIIGLGNVGFKLALKLVERGCWVNVSRRDREKLQVQVDCLNLIKPKATLAQVRACATISECLNGAHAVIATADSSDILSLEQLAPAAPNPLLVDCGKACFSAEVCAELPVYYTDVGVSLLYQLKARIVSEKLLYPKFGYKRIGNLRYICGMSGRRRDVVVNDINEPKSFVGICDGKGGFMNPQARQIDLIVEARMSSGRLPGKVMLPAVGKPMLQLMAERLQRIPGLNNIIIATTKNGTDDSIVELAEQLKVKCFRGSEDDVLGRVVQAAQHFGSEVIVEITGDDPLLDPEIALETIMAFLERQKEIDFVTNDFEKTFALGFNTRVFSLQLLESVEQRATHPLDREHVVNYIRQRPERFRIYNLSAQGIHRRPDLRLTLDTKEDYELIRKVFEELYPRNPEFSAKDIYQFLDAHPDLRDSNKHIIQRTYNYNSRG